VISNTSIFFTKQCRERWHNHVNPSINRRSWSADDDRILTMKHKELGNRWAAITRFLPGQTDTLVKNRWNTSVKDRALEIEALNCSEIPRKHCLLLMPWTAMNDFTTIPPLRSQFSEKNQCYSDD
jgi:hypothetical protein